MKYNNLRLKIKQLNQQINKKKIDKRKKKYLKKLKLKSFSKNNYNFKSIQFIQ